MMVNVKIKNIMEKANYIMKMVNLNMKENLYMVNFMEKVNYIMKMVNLNMKENLYVNFMKRQIIL